MDASSRLKAYRDAVDARLDDILPPVSGLAATLCEAMRYAALAPGKRLRPCMLLAACEAVGGQVENGLNAACAVELVHAFSLVHDDLPAIDNDDLRRGRPTCHVKFGEATAILAGDALFALAFEAIASSGQPAERLAVAMLSLAQSSGCDGLVGGEVVDVMMEGQPFTLEQVEFVHSRKTGALIAACCEMGAIFGGSDRATSDALFAFGNRVGLAFQVVDDLLNEDSNAEILGKAAGSDRARGKATYPALLGSEKSREVAESLIQSAIHHLPDLADPSMLVHLAEFAIQRRT